MKRDYTDYLQDMMDNCDKAIAFLGATDIDTLIANEEKAYAVVRALEIIGEAARHIPKELRGKYPKIAWEEASGMRDKIVHDYFGVDYTIVWDTVHRDLPILRKQVSQVLTDLQAP